MLSEQVQKDALDEYTNQKLNFHRILPWRGGIYDVELDDKTVIPVGLFQFQMRISFPFLLTKNIHRFLLLMRTRSSSYRE